MVEALVFPIKSVRRGFDLDSSFEPFRIPRNNVNWANRGNSSKLSEMLNQQVQDNLIDLNQLTIICREDTPLMYTTDFIDNETYIHHQYSNINKEERCAKFLDRFEDYQDAFGRDADVFDDPKWNVVTHGIVLLYQRQYYGHIYSWISPVPSGLCYAMGIRSRIDAIFLDERLQHVSYYLLEAARQLALKYGCTKLIITIPLPHMEVILRKLGFAPVDVPIELIGKSMATHPDFIGDDSVCYNCYERDTAPPIVLNMPCSFYN